MKWNVWHSMGLLLIIGLIVLVGFLMPSQSYLATWIVITLILLISVLVIGHGITGMWKGALIDEENKISLSRFQLLCWTVLVLSAFLSAALINITNGSSNPLAISVPEELWVLMGISTTSLVGSPLIKSNKKTKPLNSLTFKALMKKDYGPDKIGNSGYIVFNVSQKDASWGDMFKGEEVGNFTQLDLAKIQMFYFTMIAVLSYIMALGGFFASAASAISGLPELSASLIALLGISHGGYLVNKGIPRPANAGK
ncbi:MAG: hypothetical protein JXB26_19060 [Candidatus Aminicenantes bacterium]|nr:hypothetical protein [Candidatus Aminicenantes bacterium]